MENNTQVGTATTENVGAETQAVQNEEIKATEKVDKTNQVEDTEKVEEDGVKKDSEKLFTQEEVNKLIQERLERVKNKPNTEADGLRNTVEMLQNQLAEYEKELAQSQYHIKKEYLDYVDYKVSHSTNEKTDYKTALKTFMENEGKIFAEDGGGIVATPRPSNQGAQMSSDAQYIYEKYGKKI